MISVLLPERERKSRMRSRCVRFSAKRKKAFNTSFLMSVIFPILGVQKSHSFMDLFVIHSSENSHYGNHPFTQSLVFLTSWFPSI